MVQHTIFVQDRQISKNIKTSEKKGFRKLEYVINLLLPNTSKIILKISDLKVDPNKLYRSMEKIDYHSQIRKTTNPDEPLPKNFITGCHYYVLVGIKKRYYIICINKLQEILGMYLIIDLLGLSKDIIVRIEDKDGKTISFAI